MFGFYLEQAILFEFRWAVEQLTTKSEQTPQLLQVFAITLMGSLCSTGR